MDQVDSIDFYWRPGCFFCSRLDRALSKKGFVLSKHNIWEDPDAAAHVRANANGNETVPTVTVGDTSLVNPSPDQVVRLVESRAPHLLPTT